MTTDGYSRMARLPKVDHSTMEVPLAPLMRFVTRDHHELLRLALPPARQAWLPQGHCHHHDFRVLPTRHCSVCFSLSVTATPPVMVSLAYIGIRRVFIRVFSHIPSYVIHPRILAYSLHILRVFSAYSPRIHPRILA